MKCLVSFLHIENPAESAPEPPDTSTLNVHDDDVCEGNEEDDQDGELNDGLYAQNFKVKGSFFQEPYQQALLKCDHAKGKSKPLLHMLSLSLTIFRTKMRSNSRCILTVNGISLVTVMLRKFVN